MQAHASLISFLIKLSLISAVEDKAIVVSYHFPLPFIISVVCSLVYLYFANNMELDQTAPIRAV